MEKIKTTVYKSGNSQAIILQKAILNEANIHIGDEVHYYSDEKGRIIIEKKEKSFQNRWSEFVESGRTYEEEEELDWGPPAGREAW